MKTKIRKFLWFDITPRKELYREINECYQSISDLKDSLDILKSQINDKNNKLNDFGKKIVELESIIDDKVLEMHRLRSIISELKGEDGFESYESY